MDVSRENYFRSGGKIELEQYVEKIDRYIVRKSQVRENITFSLQDAIPQKLKRSVDLIIFKNRLLYYTPAAGKEILNNLLESLRPRGCLVLGYKEQIRDEQLLSRVNLLCDEDKIYQLN